MWSKQKLLSGVLILSVTSGCALGSTGGNRPIVVSDYCKIAAPISYDTAKDTKETVAAVEKHNSKWVCLCENDCPK